MDQPAVEYAIIDATDQTARAFAATDVMADPVHVILLTVGVTLAVVVLLAGVTFEFFLSRKIARKIDEAFRAHEVAEKANHEAMMERQREHHQAMEKASDVMRRIAVHAVRQNEEQLRKLLTLTTELKSRVDNHEDRLKRLEGHP